MAGMTIPSFYQDASLSGAVLSGRPLAEAHLELDLMFVPCWALKSYARDRQRACCVGNQPRKKRLDHVLGCEAPNDVLIRAAP
jgi:hypothetical protein